MLNNGMVCLVTGSNAHSATTYDFTNFTIVNGAQTTSTIAAYFEQNPADEDPVWVVAKVVAVDEADIDRARILTKTSNTQTPASNKDLRAVDPWHRRIERWMIERYGIRYAYRRGVRVPSDAVQMKDVAQAYVAFGLGTPHIPFARVGTIFSDSTLYNAAFDPEWIETVRQAGDAEDEREYLASRLVPTRIAQRARAQINARVQAGDDPKWRSLTYHLVWAYRQILDAEGFRDAIAILNAMPGLVDDTAGQLYSAMKTAMTYARVEVPRDLKTTKAVETLVESGFVDEDDQVRAVRETIRSRLSA
jgi:hypothetical protein